jgi:serine/threonine-protein kinase RsbW
MIHHARAFAIGPARVYRFRMRSRREQIGRMVERILAAVRDAEFSPEQRDDLAVAAAEALANAAVHGNRLRPNSMVTIRVDVIPGHRATIRVKDQGKGFDHAAVPDPSEKPNLLTPRGRGVFLMRRLMDRVEFNERGNEVRMTLVSPHGA